MARRSADERAEPKLLMVAPEPGSAVARRRRYVPAADLLEREGKPLEVDEDFLVADAVLSVRKGMTRIAVGLLAVVGAATVANDLMSTPTDEPPLVEERRDPPTSISQAPSTVQDVVKAAKRGTSKPDAYVRPARKSRLGSGSGGTQQSSSGSVQAPEPAPAPAPAPSPKPAPEPEPDYSEMSGNYGKDYSGNWGEDWSGNYGQDYWGG